LCVLGWTAWGFMYFVELFYIVIHVRYLFSSADTLAMMKAQVMEQKDLNLTVVLLRQDDIFNKFVAHHYTPEEILMRTIHIGASILWWTLSSLQLLEWIRKKNLNLHRWNGRLLVMTACAQLLSGGFASIYTAFGPHITAAGLLFLAAWAVTIFQTYRYAKMKSVELHSLWAVRCFTMSHAIIGQRFFLFPMLIYNGKDIALGNDLLVLRAFELSFWLSISISIAICEPLSQLIHPYFNPKKTN